MFFAWLYQLKTSRAEIVDIAWTFLVGATGLLSAAVLDGEENRRILLAIISATWSIRLGYHLIKDRFFAKSEDGRYANLRGSWGKYQHHKFLVFFMLQAFLIPLFATASIAVASNRAALGYVDIIAVAVIVIAVIGESVADKQLIKFKQKFAGQKKICDIGLWRYSRHPNYFFEWLHWLSYPLLAYSGEYWWLAWLAPVVMYFLLRYVTGVMPLEARMKQNYGDAFHEYASRVSEFWPRAPKGV